MFSGISQKCPQCYPKARWTPAPMSLHPSNVATSSVKKKKLIQKCQQNVSRKTEEIEPKQKQHRIVDVTGDGSQVQCYKVQ